MRAVAIGADRGLELIDAPQAPVMAGEVRLDVAYCGICGSDLHMLDMPGVPAGLVLGHELAGSVSEVGEAVAGWSVGDRVTVLPIVPCGECYACRGGHDHLCENGLSRGPGLGRAGGYAETVVVPAGMLRRLPDGVSEAHGALTEPLAVAIRAIALAEPSQETGVWVIGAGPIGVMTAAGLRARGVRRVVVVEVNPARREMVERLGFSTAAPGAAAASAEELFGAAAATVAIDCSGHPSGTPLAVGLLPPAGRLVVVGIPGEPAPLDLTAVAMKELSIRGSLAYSTRDFAEALDHIAAGRIPCEQIVTAVAGLDEAPRWFDDLRSGATPHLKVLLRP
ncbi:zinc-binding dehydrogenase [Conexibacter sp. CPCC 206217]|uniref:zinc-dependent alcohol dehydrogenase n=1 Tax=Conexibacter sp. CPCC 206217 TaxID=3064574 RepID=UPI002719305E|nr:alcohol dehydrogenase catalytic domain-containing protein [Conexibacter sp. CPCC 206217]MDO8212020.1 alcohol dehydrogenase catalytic domain-containing protein [Conexibacter sp. CPCC 206217]